MNRRLSHFALRHALVTTFTLMLIGSSLSSATASPARDGDIPDGVGIYGEEADPCTPGSFIFDLFGAVIGSSVGRGSSLSGTLGGHVAEEAAGEAVGEYLERSCSEAIAEIYGKVAGLFVDAYVRAEQFPASPGYPDGVGVHPWAEILIQDFWGGTDSQGNLNGDGWGAIIWGGIDSDWLPQYVGGAFWVAYKNAVNDSNVVGTNLYPGYPINEEHVWPGSTIRIQDFRGGTWGDAAIIGTDDGAWIVAGRHWEAYWQHNGQIDLRNPLGPLYIDGDGWYTQDFEGGRIRELGGDIRVELNEQNGSSGSTPPEPPPAPNNPAPPVVNSPQCGDAGIPQITEGLSYSPGSPDTKTTVEFSFTITNIGCGTFRPEVLAIGGRNPRSDVSDPLQLREFVLGPGESRRITQTAVLDIAGTQEFFMVFLRSGGGWNEIPDTSGVSQHIYINVTEAADPPADTSSDNEPAAPPPTETPQTQVPQQHYALMDLGAVGPNGHEIGAQFTVTTLDGTWLGSCTLQGSGGEPYLISCEVDVPRGTTVVVTLDTNTITPGYTPAENPVYFDTSSDPGAASYWGVVFELEAQGGSNAAESNAQSSDIAIETFLDGGPYYDACYILVGYSLEGCDANRDGMITFADIPVGTYTVTQTAALPAGYSIPDFTITVTGSGQTGTEIFGAYGNSGSASAPAVSSSSRQSDSVNIALVTRDPVDGHLLTDVCYVLAGYSLEGCDENGDGQVTFADIPFGTYTVQQTRTPAGYPTVNDFEIHVQGTGYMEGPSIAVPLNFVVKQASQQNAPNARNVSVVFLDMSTMERVTTGVCVQLAGASLVGCDEDLIDGQVDFLDVPGGGPYELIFSNLPAGSEVATVGGPLAITVPAGPSDPANVTVFVLLAGVDTGGSSTIQPRD